MAAKKKKAKDRKKAAGDASSDQDDDLGIEDVADEDCAPMPENWVPPNMLPFALWGPSGESSEVELSMQASTGPRQRRRHYEIQGDDGAEAGEGGVGDDKCAAVTVPKVMEGAR